MIVKHLPSSVSKGQGLVLEVVVWVVGGGGSKMVKVMLKLM